MAKNKNELYELRGNSLIDYVEIEEKLIERNNSKIVYELILNFYSDVKTEKNLEKEGIEKIVKIEGKGFLARIIEEDADYHEIVYGPTWYRKIELNKDLDNLWNFYLQKSGSEKLINDKKAELNEWISENPSGKMYVGAMGVPERMEFL